MATAACLSAVGGSAVAWWRRTSSTGFSMYSVSVHASNPLSFLEHERSVTRHTFSLSHQEPLVRGYFGRMQVSVGRSAGVTGFNSDNSKQGVVQSRVWFNRDAVSRELSCGEYDEPCRPSGSCNRTPLGRRFESSSTLLCAEVRALDGSLHTLKTVAITTG